ncbi:DUF2490 domain-containing protein [bacterium]|nr:DUF2490 domain-containing protein [bacterium]MBP9810992.1 DUF2490 domain-containing protein [bacterium]
MAKRKPNSKLARVSAAMALLLLLLWCEPAPAAPDHDLQLWTPIMLDRTIYKKVRGYLEVSPRVGDNVSGLNQLLLRPALEYRLKDNFSLFAGYLWLSNYTDEGVQNEHRIWQQALMNKSIKGSLLINRTRLEQRMFEPLNGAGVRLRHLVKVNYPLHKRIYATAQDELFINLNSVEGGPQAGIDQNRIFAGLGIKTIKKARVEVGYQYQYVNRSDRFDDQVNHAIVIQSFVGLKD